MRFIQERPVKRQIGYATSQNAAYTEGGGDITFAQDQSIFIRMKCWLPRYATINSAVIRFNITVKTAANAQTSYHTVRMHDVADSWELNLGSAEGQRAYTAASVTWTCYWAANANASAPDGLVYSEVDIKTLLQAHVNRSDYRPGMSMTFRVLCSNENGSDMGIRANNDFLPTPKLTADYTPNRVDDLYVDANLLNNPNLETNNNLGTDPLPTWGQNPFYGAFVGEAPNLGVIARDTSFTRLPGVPTLKFTTGTPPTENTGRSTGPYSAVYKLNEYPYIFCGWLYIPSTITSQVYAGDPYLGKSHLVTARNQWTPFCSTPSDIGTGEGAFWPAVAIRGPWPANVSIWLSEPCVLISPFKQLGFNAGTLDVKDPGGVNLIDYRGSGQTALKEWTPRTGIVRNGTLYRVPRYEMRPEGMLQNAEPIKGGPQVTGLPATAISSYPAGKTIAEL